MSCRNTSKASKPRTSPTSARYHPHSPVPSLGEIPGHLQAVRVPVVEWTIPSLDIPLYCSFIDQPSPTM